MLDIHDHIVNESLDQVTSAKYIGMFIDSNSRPEVLELLLALTRTSRISIFKELGWLSL